MYRIDENTLIDESLVTCAEYQLFIDEMRAQGKFFQPDHWAWYRLPKFPKGQAHAPILGVRPSDAQAFCAWLSGREEGEWHYRLPTGDEATKYSILKRDERLNGFWTLDANKHHFAWIGSVPINPRGIDFSNIFDRDLACARVLDRIRARALDHALDCALDIDLVLTLADAHDMDIAPALDRASSLHSPDIFFALARARARYLAPALARSLDLAPVFFIWIDLFTLQERLAGRSPAFEGIRLVKERKVEVRTYPQIMNVIASRFSLAPPARAGVAKQSRLTCKQLFEW